MNGVEVGPQEGVSPICLADVVKSAASAEHALECLAEVQPTMTVADLAAAIEVEVLELAWDETHHYNVLKRTIAMLARLMCAVGGDSRVTLEAACLRLARREEKASPDPADFPAMPRF
jgi:predicted regulator of amino acid metabolism with ACT domain